MDNPLAHLEEVLAEGRELIEKHGHVPAEVMTRLLTTMPEDMKEAFALALGVISAIAMVTEEGAYYMHNSALDLYLSVKVSPDPPLEDGVLVDFDGNVDGFVESGVRVDNDGVKTIGSRCPICGEPDCSVPADCKQRREMLAAVRNMGRDGETVTTALPPGILPNVDDTP